MNIAPPTDTVRPVDLRDTQEAFRRAAGWPLLRGMGDHFLMVLLRR